jgi:drug/metabolite transporter (DMT)-like permease
MNLLSTKYIGYASAVISTVLLGSVGIFVRNISLDEYVITVARLGIGFLFLIIFLIPRREMPRLRLKNFSFPLISTGILLALTMLFYMKAINSTSLANAVFLLYLGPIIAAGISAVFLKEKFTFLNIVLLCLAFLGFLFLLEFKISLTLDNSQGFLWGVGAAVCYASYIVINRIIPIKIGSMTRSFYQFLFGLVVMIPFIFKSVNLDVSLSDIYWLTGIAFFQGFLAITLIIVAIKNLKTVEYGTISYVEPLVASFIGFMLYNERLTTLQIIGCTIILASGLIRVFKTNNSA